MRREGHAPVHLRLCSLYPAYYRGLLCAGEATPLSIYTTHRLLAEEGLYFKPLGRAPPLFRPRSEAEVQATLTQRTLAAARAEEEAEFVRLLSERRPAAEVRG